MQPALSVPEGITAGQTKNGGEEGFELEAISRREERSDGSRLPKSRASARDLCPWDINRKLWRRGRDSNLKRFAGVRSVATGAGCRNPERQRGTSARETLTENYGGEGGIRTPDTRQGMAAFEAARFNRSRTSPHQMQSNCRSFDSVAGATSLRISAAVSPLRFAPGHARKAPQLSRRLVSTAHAPLHTRSPLAGVTSTLSLANAQFLGCHPGAQ